MKKLLITFGMVVIVAGTALIAGGVTKTPAQAQFDETAVLNELQSHQTRLDANDAKNAQQDAAITANTTHVEGPTSDPSTKDVQSTTSTPSTSPAASPQPTTPPAQEKVTLVSDVEVPCTVTGPVTHVRTYSDGTTDTYISPNAICFVGPPAPIN